MPEKTHGERWLVVNGRTLTYSGIFHIKELFSTINISLQKKGYTLKEKRNEEVVTENGRNIFFELRPYKEMTKQVTLLIKLKINLKNVTQQVQELRGNIFSFDKGDIEIVFDSWSYTDFEDRWAAKALPFTISTVIDKIFLRLPRLQNFRGEVASDTGFVYNAIKELLSSYRRRDVAYVSEDEVRKQIEAEIEEAQDMPDSENTTSANEQNKQPKDNKATN